MTVVLIGALVVALWMLALWGLHFILKNAAIVDVGWASGLSILGLIYAVGSDGWWERRVIVALMSSLWGLRLAIHLLLTRVIHQPEEGRYVELRRKWRTNLGAKFLAFFEFQALLCLVLAMPYWLAVRNPSSHFHWLEIVGMAVWLVGLCGEAVADHQLTEFKKGVHDRGKTCRVGLWRLSRHPNYFFEWLVWVGFAAVAFPADEGWLGLISPALILYFLLRVTGIPATEEQALRTRGEDYRDYQRVTSAFIPWFPKHLSPHR